MFSSPIYHATLVNYRCTGGFTYFALHFIHATFCIEPRTVKDYGGIGGLKTVSIRSLGAQHTAVGYDGIAITDCQTGQIDIGRFSLDNVDQLSLSNGQSDNIFQPARFFASAGILDIQTLTPRFEKGKRTNISAAFKTGSWGLVNPSILLEQQLSPNGQFRRTVNGCRQTDNIRTRYVMETQQTT